MSIFCRVFAVSWAFGSVALAQEEGEEKPKSGTVTGTFGEGVTLTTPDEKLQVTIRGRGQVRTSLLAPGDGDPSNDPAEFDPETGLVSEFVVRRARLLFTGYALSKDLTYYVQLAFSNQDTESDLRLPLRDAYATWQRQRDLNLRVGQMKVPFSRQRVVSSGSLQMVDRSLVTAELNLDRDVGLQLTSKDLGGQDGRLVYSLGVFGGDGRNRLGTEFGYLGVARFAVRPMGEFDDMVEADVGRRSDPKLAFGAAAAWNQNTNRPRSTLDVPYEAARFDYLHLTADAVFKWRGLSATGEWIFRDADVDRSVDDETGLEEFSRSGWGWFAQAGYMLTDHLEVSGRYGHLLPTCQDTTDSLFARCTAEAEFSEARELGGGASWYFLEHDLKVQGDYFYLPVASSPDDTARLDDGTHQIRVQGQLWF